MWMFGTTDQNFHIQFSPLSRLLRRQASQKVKYITGFLIGKFAFSKLTD
jgi:hypothetical protein